MKKKRLISLALAFTLTVTLIIPAWLPVYAVDISGGNITGDSGGGSNAQMTYDAGFTTDIENTQETTITGTSDTDKMAADSVTEAVYPDDANTQATALRAFEFSMEADITVDTWAELAAAVSAAPTGTETIIEIGSGFNAGSVINIPSDTDIVIQSSVGETYTITRNNGFTDTFFKVKGGGKLALENVILDGNGSSVTATAPVMYISSTGEFTMDGATIQNVKGNVDFGQPAGVFVQTNGTMTMKNGSVIENVVNITAFGAFYVAGTLNMEDSSVINCTGTNCGGVAVLNGIFNMSGSSVITGNKGDFGGVELSTTVIFNLSGSPDISRNIKTNGTTPCNVFFGGSGMTINIAGTLSNTTPVGVTSYVAVTKSNPKDITAESDQNWSSYFTSDNPSYKIRNSGKDSSQVVRLVISGIYTWDDLAAAVSAAPAGTETVLDIMTDLDADSEIDIPTGADIVIQSGSGGPYTITRDASFVNTVFKVAGGGKLTLKNAAMDGNDANVTSTSPMVYVVDSGDFTLDTGASIQNINGSVPAQSAGVYAEPGSAVTIKNGAAINHVVNSYSYGAMYVGGTLNMEGGSITGCEGTACGGVYVDAAGTVNMSGSSVTGNTGGGIAVAGEINLSGAPDISGNHLGDGTDCNLYLQSYDAQQINNVVNVAGELTNTTPIGITTIISPSEGSPVSITAASNHDWSSYFTSDVPSYVIQNSGSGSSQVVQLAVNKTVYNTINVSDSSGSNLPTGVSYNVGSKLFTIDTLANNSTITVIGTTSTNTIEVVDGVSGLTLILNGVSITSATVPPIDLQGSSDVTLQLADDTTNTLDASSSSGVAGLCVPSTAAVSIQADMNGTGILNATGSSSGGAGIGGTSGNASGYINISGGTVNATGGTNGGAGIGGGNSGNGGTTIISGGTITATSGNNAAGIGGGGVTGSGGNITISGGIVIAKGIGGSGAGIGGGANASGGIININGSANVNATSSYGGAGIGSGNNGSSTTINIGGTPTIMAASMGTGKPAINASSGSGSVINAQLNAAISPSATTYLKCNGNVLSLPATYRNFAFSAAAASTVKAYSNPSCTTLLGSIVTNPAGLTSIPVTNLSTGPANVTDVMLPTSYTATVAINKDGSAWTSTTPTIKLYASSSSLTGEVSGTVLNGVYTFTGLNPVTTYYAWDATNSKYTGQSVTSGSPNATVNYYTVTLSSTAGITSTSGSGTYLSGSDVPISAAVTGGYNWSKWVLNSNGNLVSTANAYTITSISSAQSYKAVATASNAPAIQTTSLPDGTAGTAYSQNLSAMSLTPFTLGWSIVSGSLPTGLGLIPSTGTISGTPSVSGTFNFTVQATDSNGSSTKALSITILPVLSGTVNLTIDPSNGQVTALATGGNTDSEGTLTYTWSGGATGTGTTATPTPGTVTACTVTASGASGSVSASITVYKVTVTKSGNTGTDDAFIANAYGKAGDSIGIAYTLDSTGTQSNTLTYGGAATSPGAVSTPGSGTSTYIISTGDASSGTIPLTATFSHISIQTYVLTINGGGTGVSGAGAYASGDLVSINAGTKNGYTFSGWTTSNGGSFADESRTSTTFTMPANNTTITAAFTHNGGGGGSDKGSGGSTSTPTTTPTPTPANVPIIIDNNNYDIGKVVVEGDTATITVGQSEFEKQLTAAKYSVVVPVTSDAKTVVAQLVVKNVQDMNDKGVPLTVQTGNINYNIPASSIDTKEILSALGAPDPSLAPVNVIIRTDVDPATQILVNSAVKAAKSKEVVPALQFEITASYNGKTYKIENFDRFVSRSVEITSDQAQQTTTAIVIDTDGTIRHVPTFVYQKNGKWYAQINSLTNSTYALIFNQMSFSDAEGKWYQSVVKEMGSRKIINGVGSNDFAGDKAITRAEFAAIVVRALGLPATGTATFKDVPSGSWYSGAVATAAHYGIVNGIGGNKFSPDAKITREQAMQMICNASKLTPYMAVTGSDNTKSFTDYGTQSVWATNAVNFNINNGFIQGFKGQFNPKSDITRAETAAVVLRLLQKSGLVDVRTKL